ncbi:hypothetical protein [Algoriphagus boritolerans]|uniref:hypothetical protein n=1 Tax=Algoriphagus boritolerans TaxID=308111 RepID=UPI000A6F774D
MESQGKRYKKKSLVRAKKAEPGLVVVTRTSDGIETKNTAEKGDWFVENQTSAKESYLIKAETFEKKIQLVGFTWKWMGMLSSKRRNLRNESLRTGFRKSWCAGYLRISGSLERIHCPQARRFFW